jgi:hypothetical protein
VKTLILTDRRKNHASYPDIAAFKGNILCTWQESTGKEDVIMLAEADMNTGKILNRNQLNSASGIGFMPRITASESEASVVWAEKDKGQWALRSVSWDGTVLGSIQTCGCGRGLFDPLILNGAGKSGNWIFWTDYEDSCGTIMGRELGREDAKPVLLSTGARSAGRPAGAAGYDGKIWLAWDGNDARGYHIYIQHLDNGLFSAPLVISASAHWASRPGIVPLENSMLVTWYETAPGNRVSYWSTELVRVKGNIVIKQTQEIDMTHNWYCWSAVSRNPERDLTYLLFSRGWRSTGVRSYNNGSWSREFKIPSEQGLCVRRARGTFINDLFGIAWQRSEGNGQLPRWSDVGITVISDLSDLEPVPETDGGNIFNLPVKIKKELASPKASRPADWDGGTGALYSGKKLLWGDIHGQSGLSDGQGEVDEYFCFARDIAKLDFTALTDHDCFPNILSPAEFAYTCTVSNAFNNRSGLITLLAYEWTSNEYKTDYGHKNVYFPGDEGAIFRATDEDGDSPPVLFENIKKHGAICIPHHPAAMWDMASAATDWNYHDEEVQRLVEIFSRHANFEQCDTKSVYTKNVKQEPGRSVPDALKRGYKLGIIAGSDSHQLEHGIEGGILGAYVHETSRKGVFDALYNRSVYATTGARIRLEYSLNNTMMGGTLKIKKGEPVELVCRCLGTSVIEAVDIISGCGILRSFQIDEDYCDLTYVIPAETELSWCYIRITQYDNHLAWSSPIWIEYASKEEKVN